MLGILRLAFGAVRGMGWRPRPSRAGAPRARRLQRRLHRRFRRPYQAALGHASFGASTESVRLSRSFVDMMEYLSSPSGADMIDLAGIQEEWREVARCVNEGLLLYQDW